MDLMTRRWMIALLLLAVVGHTTDVRAADEAIAAARKKSFKISNCLVSLIGDVELAAKRSGVLASMDVKEGTTVKAGQLLGTIDKAQAEMQGDVARAELESARARAQSALEIESAEAQYRSASIEYTASVDANRLAPRSYSSVQMDKLALAVKDAQLRIQAAKLEQTIEVINERVAAAKVKLAEVEVADRTITAPVEGQVVEIFRQKDEWVDVGKPLLRIAQLDRLRVEAFVRFAEHAPEELVGRKLTASVATAGGRTRTFPGVVTFVSPIVQQGGQYKIWAEVDNKYLGLRPGLSDVELEILAE
jgi:multidrug resistance efflux pump